MLFNSYSFIIFFLLVFTVSRLIGNWTLNKTFLLAVSYVFYAAWNPPFVIILWITTVIDWYCAQWIHKTQKQSARKTLLTVSLFSNLGMLCFFKYAGFFIENINHLLQFSGITFSISKPSIVLPVGISFYTFQTLSYVLDVYRNKTAPGKSFLDYALYVTFFPQLVAGPIMRAVDFLPQCEKPKKGNGSQVGYGLMLFVLGLFNKIVIADSFMAPIVERVFDGTGTPGFFSAWAGALAFSIQIFCDFAGYSTCAIGIALTMGFYLMTNFRFPYAAVGFSDFWTRWHISLSSWLKDYLYIPLGGNRKGKLRTHINLMTTMLLGGLWHGASWLFVLWGALHGVLLVAEKAVRNLPIAKKQFWKKQYGQIFLALLTFGFVCYTWVFFRAKTLSRAWDLIMAMSNIPVISASRNIWMANYEYALVAVCTIAVLVIHYIMRHRTLESVVQKIPWWIHSVLISAMLYTILTSFSGEDRAFIYFQF